MDASRVADFSIERILSPQLGLKRQVMEGPPDGHLQGFPGLFSLDLGGLRAPVPMSGWLQYLGMSPYYPYGTGFHRTDFSGIGPNPGVSVHFSSNDSADVQLLPGYRGWHQAAFSAQLHRPKARMRTVFTASQTKQLAALFELTDYPTVEVRAEMASRTGLSEETVRVWFKNRRARRKRSRVKSPSSPLSAGEENHSPIIP